MTGDTRTQAMKQLAERLQKIQNEVERLSYESYVLGQQGKLEASFKKKKAAEFARAEWIKSNRIYKKHWRAWRKNPKENTTPEQTSLC